MTFSLVAREPDSPVFGVAVASKFLAVGALVPAADVAAGALATQANANLAYRPDGLALLRAGAPAEEVVAVLTGRDSHAADRQLGVVGRDGRGAAHTGDGCEPWAGHLVGESYALQGNCLTGPEVLSTALEAFTAAEGPLARRLLAGLAAGDAAGGDKRGRQSAALLVVAPGAGYGGGSDVLVDLRVDDHAAPVEELARLLDLHDLYAGPAADVQPWDGELAAEVDRLVRTAGGTSLRQWVGVVNLEERWSDDGIDARVLAALREAAA